MRPEQQVQEDQYAFPYHYLPQIENGFHQHAYWSWGFRYLGGMAVANALCEQEPFDSLLDLGCGDGRFISDLARRQPALRLLGVDYSERAIALARALNPGLDYRAIDIVGTDLREAEFDVVTLIEVIEHIPPEELPRFLERAVSLLRSGGRLVITAPHRNKRLGDKHFQHFDASSLTALLSPHLRELHVQPFDLPSRLLGLWFRLMGRAGKYFLITWQPLLNAFYAYYAKHCLHARDETRCGRIACVGRKP
jgi:SAM-dependent methyltransferase